MSIGIQLIVITAECGTCDVLIKESCVACRVGADVSCMRLLLKHLWRHYCIVCALGRRDLKCIFYKNILIFPIHCITLLPKTNRILFKTKLKQCLREKCVN